MSEDKKQVVIYSITDAAISKLKQEYLTLKVNGIDDIENYVIVKEAHQVVKKIRCSIDPERKRLTEEARKHVNFVNQLGKDIEGKVREVEDHLYSQRRVVEDEKDRIAEEARQKILAEEARVKKEEEDRIEAEKKKLEEDQRKVKEAQDKIEADQRRIEEDKQKIADEKAEIERKKKEEAEAKKKAEQDEKDRVVREKKHAEDLERVKKEAEEKAEQDKKDEKEAEKARIAEKERQKELAPDKEKLKEYAVELIEVVCGKVYSDEAQEVLKKADLLLAEVTDCLYRGSDNL